MDKRLLDDESILEFYRDFEGSNDYSPMIELVERISAKDYALHFQVGISLDILGIDNGATGFSVQDRPDSIVYNRTPQQYWKRRSYFAVQCGGPDRQIDKYECSSIEEAESLIDCLAIRLYLASQANFSR